MLLVKTEVKQSFISGAGLGLFAAEFIFKGTVIWEFTPEVDRKYLPEEAKYFPDHVKAYLKLWTWLSRKNGCLYFCGDESRYTNHSFTPNTSPYYSPNLDPEGVSIANQDIQVGEEITTNYTSFEDLDDPTMWTPKAP